MCQNWYIMVLMRFLFLLFVLPFIYCKELRYALFTSGSTGGFDSSGAVPAIELAEELINADSSILPGYNLSHTPVVDTVVSRSIDDDQSFSSSQDGYATFIMSAAFTKCSVTER